MEPLFLGVSLAAILVAIVVFVRENKWRSDWYQIRRQLLFPILAAVMLVVLLALPGCASLSDPAKPRTEAEQFPLRNQDPRVGLVVNNGTAPSNLVFYDQANRIVVPILPELGPNQQLGRDGVIYMSGADRVSVRYDGQSYPQYKVLMLEPGCYRAEVWPFYKTVRWTLPPVMVRADLPKQTYSVCVGANPTAYYYGGRYWGWVLQIGTNIPDGATGLPSFQVLNPFGR